MTLVVDASVVVAGLVDPRSDGAWAEELLLEESLLAPELLLAEVANILRRLEASGAIRSAEASAAFTDLLDLSIVLYGFAPHAARVWELRHNVTAYDAWYVALAEGAGVPLATLDTRLAAATGPRCPFSTPPPAEE